ncbi:MAG TPA: beta-ketoacyl-ACP synthase II, partial [Clostridia bacterium]|nr:beta-ketoacyl-ACP synthase II [Clostridia bacterium]
MTQRVVVTGLGIISPVGIGIGAFWSSLVKGKSGIGRISQFDPKELSTQIAGEVVDFDPTLYFNKKEARRMDRFTQFAVAAAGMALEDSGLDLGKINKDRAGVVLGSGVGGIKTLEEQAKVLYRRGPNRISPFFVPSMIANIGAGQIAINYDLRGPNITTVTACASSNNALGEAYKIIQRGQADILISGGSEAPITSLAVGGFCSMKALSTFNDEPEKASRPFDAKRDGFVISEGAVVLVLERLDQAEKRGAQIYGEIIGYGSTCDAYHITAPDPEGKGAAKAMEAALFDAEIEPGEVNYINAHGTSTPLNDKLETKAIKKIFGQHAGNLLISSTKSMTGHLLGAAGGLEAAACLLALREGVVPPTINYEFPDKECDLNYVPNKAEEATLNVALSNS